MLECDLRTMVFLFKTHYSNNTFVIHIFYMPFLCEGEEVTL